jgi:hypothetical protein
MPAAESCTVAVICRGDRATHGFDEYELATRRIFSEQQDAEAYAFGVSPSRGAVVVLGDWADVAARGAQYGSRVYIKIIRNPSPTRPVGFGAQRILGVAPAPTDARLIINDYSALRLPGVARTPLGACDCNGATLYAGDWIRDTVTGFVMCAATFKVKDSDGDDDFRFVSEDGGHRIELKHAVLHTPDPKTPIGMIAHCDQEAHAGAVAAKRTPQPQGPSVFENLDEWI